MGEGYQTKWMREETIKKKTPQKMSPGCYLHTRGEQAGGKRQGRDSIRCGIGIGLGCPTRMKSLSLGVSLCFSPCTKKKVKPGPWRRHDPKRQSASLYQPHHRHRRHRRHHPFPCMWPTRTFGAHTTYHGYHCYHRHMLLHLLYCPVLGRADTRLSTIQYAA